MGSKPWLYPAPSYRSMETYWDTDEDAPGPRCGHTLTAVAASKSNGPRLILFGGATAIEGGASSSAPGISIFISLSLISSFVVWNWNWEWKFGSFFFFYCFLRRVSWCDKFCSFLWCFDQEMDQVSFWGFCIFSWSLYLLGLNWVLVDLGVWILWIGCRIRPAGDPPSPRAAHAAAAVGTMVVFQVIEGNVYVKKIGILELGFWF